jgi:hypothetical protein
MKPLIHDHRYPSDKSEMTNWIETLEELFDIIIDGCVQSGELSQMSCAHLCEPPRPSYQGREKSRSCHSSTAALRDVPLLLSLATFCILPRLE